LNYNLKHFTKKATAGPGYRLGYKKAARQSKLVAARLPKLCSLFHHENTKKMENTNEKKIKPDKITAICFGSQVYKYHIRNKKEEIDSFEVFIKKKGVKYINYYCSSSKEYIHRKSL
jgi:hypothetical protein